MSIPQPIQWFHTVESGSVRYGNAEQVCGRSFTQADPSTTSGGHQVACQSPCPSLPSTNKCRRVSHSQACVLERGGSGPDLLADEQQGCGGLKVSERFMICHIQKTTR